MTVRRCTIRAELGKSPHFTNNDKSFDINILCDHYQVIVSEDIRLWVESMRIRGNNMGIDRHLRCWQRSRAGKGTPDALAMDCWVMHDASCPPP